MRRDLLALDDDALVALANRGLVKRARRAVDRGEVPAVRVEEGAVVATFADGTVSRLPPGVALREADCSCGAPKVCRHRIAAVMAYRATESEPAAEGLPPLSLDEPALRSRLGGRSWARATRVRAAGYAAEVRFGRTPEVLLPTCTVRFLVPWELAHIRCDCTRSVDCEHLALALWAVDAAAAKEGTQRVVLGAVQARADRDERAEVRALQSDLLRAGWTRGGTALDERLARLRARLERARMVWVADGVGALARALAAYDASAGTADAVAIGAHLGELGLRVDADGPRAERVGAQAPGVTALDHTVLRGVGARYRVEGERARLQVFFQAGVARDALVLERGYPVGEGGPPEGRAVGRRRLLGSAVRVLAAGSVTTRAATRRPNRLVEVRGQASRQTSVVPGSGSALQAAAESLASVRERLVRRDPAPLAARVRAWRVVLTRWTEVLEVGWDPGQRAVWGRVADGTDEALVALEWRPEAEGGPACLGRALSSGGPSALGAEASLREGRLWLEPLLLAGPAGLEVPDLCAELELPALAVEALPASDSALGRALERGRVLLAELAQRGLDHLTSPQLQRASRVGEDLGELGLGELHSALRAVAGDGDRVQPWRRAWARVVVLQHLHACGAGLSDRVQ